MSVHPQGFPQLCFVGFQLEDIIAVISSESAWAREAKQDALSGYIFFHEISDRPVATICGDGEWLVEFHSRPHLMGPQQIIF